MRVVVTQVPPVAAGYTEVARALGHEVSAILVGHHAKGNAAAFFDAAPGADIVFLSSKRPAPPRPAQVKQLLRPFR